MCRVTFYVRNDQKEFFRKRAALLQKLQKCSDTEVSYLRDFREIEKSINQISVPAEDYDNFFIQLVTLEMAAPKCMGLRYLGVIRDNIDSDVSRKKYIELLKGFIRLSGHKDRFSILRNAAESRKDDMAALICRLEKGYETCYGRGISQTCIGQISEAVNMMEDKWEGMVQKTRRQFFGMNDFHIYMIVGFRKNEIPQWGQTDMASMMTINGGLVNYRFVLTGDSMVRYDIREFYANDEKSLDVLVKAHKAGKISDEWMILHSTEKALAECLAPGITVNPGNNLASGYSFGRGAASGKVIFGDEPVDMLRRKHDHFILVKNDLTPADLEYIYIADGILTGKCSSTSHQAIIAKELGKVFVYACEELKDERGTVTVGKKILDRDSELTLDGKTGNIYSGTYLLDRRRKGLQNCRYLMDVCARYKKISIYANTESIQSAERMKSVWWEGIGLYRTEYMPPQNRIRELIQKIVLTDDYEIRKMLLGDLQHVWEGELSEMFGVTGKEGIVIRTLDYPLKELFSDMGADFSVGNCSIRNLPGELNEKDSMLGNRGCRFSVSYPEIFEAQVESVFRAYNMVGGKVRGGLKLLYPMVSDLSELRWMKAIVERIVSANSEYRGINYKTGIMVETPRAIMTIDKLAAETDFLAFGTNDLTQMVWGLSREDYPPILNKYRVSGLMDRNPYEVLDKEGVLPLIRYAVRRARDVNPKIIVGVCGEQAFQSEKDLCGIGIDYISVSADNIPYAVLTAAQVSVGK